MKVIFWDIDGVLNHPRIWGAWSKLGWPAALDPVLVKMACRATKVAGAKCVLSSTWRLGRGYEDTMSALAVQGWPSASHDFIGKTPHMGTARGIEIGEWLLAHPEVRDYAIVDDDTDMTTHHARLVQTDYRVGLTASDVGRLLELFRPVAETVT